MDGSFLGYCNGLAKLRFNAVWVLLWAFFS